MADESEFNDSNVNPEILQLLLLTKINDLITASFLRFSNKGFQIFGPDNVTLFERIRIAFSGESD